MQEKRVRFRKPRDGDAAAALRGPTSEEFDPHDLAAVRLQEGAVSAPDGADGSDGAVAAEAGDVLRRNVTYG